VVVLRDDGQVWEYATIASMPSAVLTTTGGATPFLATTIARGRDFACALRADGTVWCWCLPNGSGFKNSEGELGDGNAGTCSAVPVQVVTGAGPALSGIKKVFAGGFTTYAVDASGNLWGWGAGWSGVLGTGFMTNSAVATQVLASSGGAQFTGVDLVATNLVGTAIGSQVNHACAHKTDGTLWCWGDNSVGQVGVGTAQASYPYPTQVTALSTTVVDVSAENAASCATTNDGSVWCWGDNGNHVIAGSNVTSSNVPIQVLSSTGGAPVSGAAHVQMMTGRVVCLLKSADRSIDCWGPDFPVSANTPTPWTDSGAAVQGAFYLGRNLYGPTFIAHDGTVHAAGNSPEQSARLTNQVPCP
jgi:hypothetical protein